MYEISVKLDFSAAHHLREYCGKCENPHGHNWKVEATVSDKSLDSIGILVDFRVLKKRLRSILEGLDHTDLNNLEHFKKNNPTSENIAKFIFESLKTGGITPSKVSVWESEAACATYTE